MIDSSKLNSPSKGHNLPASSIWNGSLFRSAGYLFLLRPTCKCTRQFRCRRHVVKRHRDVSETAVAS